MDRAIPLWNPCLDNKGHRERLRINVNGCGRDDFECPRHVEASEWPNHDWIFDHSDELKVLQPTVNTAYLALLERQEDEKAGSVDLIKQFSGGLQVIFKLASVYQTPEKPTYSGSQWHVEGALNEHICATSLFYYDQREHPRQLH